MAKKRCLVIRHGGYGDTVMTTVALPYIKDDGYDIYYYTNDRGETVLANNPRIKKVILHDESIPIENLVEHWEKIGKEYDKVVNFHDLLENKVLFAYPQPEYFWPLKKRRKFIGDINYYDIHIMRAGYEVGKYKNPEIYFSFGEKRKVKAWKKKHEGEFKIVWALIGSAHHKIYRYFEQTCKKFLSEHEDAHLFTVGDYSTKLLSFSWPRVTNTMFWEMPYRDSMILAAHCDLFIGPETGLSNVVGSTKVPKIVMLTHSGKRQLTDYYWNDHSIQAHTWCSPCFLLSKYKFIWRYKCPVSELGTSRCCEHGKGYILERMEKVYAQWKRHNKKDNKRYGQGLEATGAFTENAIP